MRKERRKFTFEHQSVTITIYEDNLICIEGGDANGEMALSYDEWKELTRYVEAWKFKNEDI